MITIKMSALGRCLIMLVLLLGWSGTQVQADQDAGNRFQKPGKYVFAHYMVCFCTNVTTEDYQREILLAQQHGIDGFALNCGAWSKKQALYYKTRVVAMYEAAEKLKTDFKLFISADYAGDLSLEETRDMIETFRDHPNQFRHQGKPVLSTWAGGKKQADFITQEFHGDRAIVFVPCLLPQQGRIDAPDQAGAEQLIRDYPNIDGYFHFGAAQYTQELVQSTQIFAQRWHEAGKLFMASATPYYRGIGMNYRVFERHGFQGMAAQWEAAIQSNADWMEITTWNDWGESTYISPVNSSLDTQYLGALLSHDGYLDASRYYIDWFKSGVAPTITRDQIFYFYRLHPKNIEGLSKPGYKGTDHPNHWKALEDDVYVTTFLTLPAKLTIFSGSASQSFELQAGVHHVRLPFAAGQQRFVLERENTTLIDKIGEYEISASDASGNFNYFSGSARAEAR